MKQYLWAVLAVCMIGCGGEALDGDLPSEESPSTEEAASSPEVSTEPEATEGDTTRTSQACTVLAGYCSYACGWQQYKRCCSWNGRGYSCYTGWYCTYTTCIVN